jgi:hypothetical protein
MFLLNGLPLSPDSAFKTPDGTQYPANWLRLSSQEERTAIGISEVPDPAVYDQRFYWGYSEDGELIPKDHTQLVEQWTQQTRTTAGTLLVPTDWMIIRETDNGIVVPEDIKTWRQNIRLAAGDKNNLISTTNTTEELAAYITGAEYPVWPNKESTVEDEYFNDTGTTTGAVINDTGTTTGAVINDTGTITGAVINDVISF